MSVQETPIEERVEAFLRELSKYSHYVTADDLPEEYRVHVHPAGDSGFLSVFHHPLLVQMMPMQLPAPIEKVLADKQADLAALAQKGDWIAYMLQIERPYRMQALLDLEASGALGDTWDDPRAACRFWKLAAEMWTDAEHDEGDPIWMAMLSAAPHIGFMTSSEDRRWLRAQPEVMTLYRGVQAASPEEALENGLEGVQWTTERSVASFFARRHLMPPDTPYILSAEISKADIMAYLTDRNEAEAIVPTGTVAPSAVTVSEAVGDWPAPISA